MKKIIITHECDVLGIDRCGFEAAITYTFNSHDVEQMKDDNGIITQKSFEKFLKSRYGDFQSITDYKADIGDNLYVKDWESEDNGFLWNDAMFGECE